MPTTLPEKTYAGLILGWDTLEAPGLHGDAIAASVAELCGRGVSTVILTGRDPAEFDDICAAVPPEPGYLYLVSPDQPAAYRAELAGPEMIYVPGGGEKGLGWSVRWALEELWRLGIGPGLVLATGDSSMAAEAARHDRLDHIPPDDLEAVLADQLHRRTTGRVPDLDVDARWCIVVEADATVHEMYDSLLTVANGVTGTRGRCLDDRAGHPPLVVAEGVYDVGEEGQSRQLAAPDWTSLTLRDAGGPGRRVLDMYTGTYLCEVGDSFRSARFASLHESAVVALRAEADEGLLGEAEVLRPSGQTSTYQGGGDGGVVWGHAVSRSVGSIAAAATERTRSDEGLDTLERIAFFVPAPEGGASIERASEGARAASAEGFDRLVARHRAAWASRWQDAAVRIEGDAEIEKGSRLALFHLLGSAGSNEATALGARGLTGPAYAGHVFWDTDVFALPALAATNPSAARALLEYRIRRLPAARRTARDEGRDGARFPWESARTGVDVTPKWVRDEQGKIMPILTGDQEIHIVADVAWATLHYEAWTGDRAFVDGPGRPLVTETARYWASRIESGADGFGHIRDVIGPDEYHESVADNAFTNVMARWNLRRGAELVRRDGSGGTGDEAETWLQIADQIYDGYDPTTGLYEQFTGFYDLEPLLVGEITATPVAADLVLGRELVSRSQIVKQADVLMLHHMVPEEVASDSLTPNLEFYGPRTSHGSSLSPAIHASLLARSGRPDDALDMLRVACRIDLEDLTGTTARGVHLATSGGIWQALAFGFAGIRPGSSALQIDPILPSQWELLELRLRFRDVWVKLEIGHDALRISVDQQTLVNLPGVGDTLVEPPGASFARRAREWKVE